MAATGIQFWVNGPVTLYAGTGSASALEKVGITEAGVGIEMMGGNSPVYSDDLGPETPRDVLLYPEHAFIRFDLNQFDETVTRKLLARFFKRAGAQTGGTPGTYMAADPGSLVQAEGLDYRLLVYAPYSAKSQYTGLNSHNFLSAFLEGQVSIAPLGTRLKKFAGVFHAIPQKQGDGSFVTYNSTVTGIPA